MPRRMIPSIVAMLLALAWAAEARAGQILFAHSAGRDGADIWIMDDDGANARPFITLAHLPDRVSRTLSAPAVDEATGAVLFNGFVGTSGSTGGLAVYMLRDGRITRLSRGAGGSGEGSTADADPEPFGNGAFIFRGQSCTGQTCNVTVFETQSMSDTAADGQLETRAGWPTACDGSGALTSPVPHPSDPARVAYSGCVDPSSFSAERQLLVSGPARAGEKVISIDDQAHISPAWRADGGMLAAIERGDNSGVHVYDPTDDTRDRRRVLAVPSYDTSINSLSFLGPDALVFDRRIGNEQRLYRMSTSCADCDPDASAQLLRGGPGESSFDPDWTPRASLQGPAPAGATPTPAPTQTAPGAAPSPALLGNPEPRVRYSRTQRLAAGRLLVTARCAVACLFTTRGTNVKAGGRSYALRTVTRGLRAGTSTRIGIRLSAKARAAARRALRRGRKARAELVLTAYYGQNAPIGGPVIRTVRLR